MTRAMPRYELSNEFFWTIELSGSKVTTSLGRIGYAGHARIKDHGSGAEAKRQHDQLVAEKLAQGYVLVGGADLAKPKKSAKPAKKRRS